MYCITFNSFTMLLMAAEWFVTLIYECKNFYMYYHYLHFNIMIKDLFFLYNIFFHLKLHIRNIWKKKKHQMLNKISILIPRCHSKFVIASFRLLFGM